MVKHTHTHCTHAFKHTCNYMHGLSPPSYGCCVKSNPQKLLAPDTSMPGGGGPTAHFNRGGDKSLQLSHLWLLTLPIHRTLHSERHTHAFGSTEQEAVCMHADSLFWKKEPNTWRQWDGLWVSNGGGGGRKSPETVTCLFLLLAPLKTK